MGILAINLADIFMVVQRLEATCHCEERQRRSNHVFEIASCFPLASLGVAASAFAFGSLAMTTGYS